MWIRDDSRYFSIQLRVENTEGTIDIQLCSSDHHHGFNRSGHLQTHPTLVTPVTPALKNWRFYALNQQVRLATAGLYQSKPKGRGKVGSGDLR